MRYNYLVAFNQLENVKCVKYAATCQNLEWVNNGLRHRVEYLGPINKENLPKRDDYVWKLSKENPVPQLKYLLITMVDQIMFGHDIYDLLGVFYDTLQVHLPFKDVYNLDSDEIAYYQGLLINFVDEDCFEDKKGLGIEELKNYYNNIKKLYYDFYLESRLCDTLKIQLETYLALTLSPPTLSEEQISNMKFLDTISIFAGEEMTCYPQYRVHGNDIIYGKNGNIWYEIKIRPFQKYFEVNTHMMDYAFADYKGIKKVSISDDITTFGKGAFAYCDDLEEVVFEIDPASLPGEVIERLGTAAYDIYLEAVSCEAFYKCSKLVSLKLPKTVKRIGERAFDFCGALSDTNVLMNTQVEIIETCAFSSCYKLKTLHLPDTLKIIGDYAFLQSGLTAMTIPESVTKLGIGAFSDCKHLLEVTLPKGLEVIPKDCFTGCEQLEYIEWPTSLTKIEEHAFFNCNFTEVVIPESVTEIGDGAFAYCKNLEKIYFPASVEILGDCDFDVNAIIYCKEGSVVHKRACEKDWFYVFF